MDSDKIINLETLAGITIKLEFELNRVKDWIKSQLSDAELDVCKNNFQTAHTNFEQIDPNLNTLNNFAENVQIFSASDRQQMPLLTSVPIVSTLTSLSNQNSGSSSSITDTSITKSTTILDKNESQNLETNEFADNEIEIIKDTRNNDDEPDLIIPHSNSKITENTEKDEDEPTIIATAAGSVTQNKRKRKEFKSDILSQTTKKHENKNAKGPHICTVCSKEFNTIANFKIHQEIHSTTKKHQCKFCSRFFKTYNSKSNHISRVHRSERNNFEFKCDECGFSFKKESALENHKIEAHLGIECKYCNTVFYSRQRLCIHIQGTHLICATPDCEKKFLSEDALKHHRRKKHLNNRANHQNI